jgi:hypothetical protein
MTIASIQIVRIVQLCLSTLATFLLAFQVNKGMMGYCAYFLTLARFESKYYFTSLGIYLYANLLSLLSITDSFTGAFDKVLVKFQRGFKERIFAGVLLDIVLMFGWIASTGLSL